MLPLTGLPSGIPYLRDGTQNREPKADSGIFTLKKDEVVLLKHRIIFHEGDEKAAGIAEAYRAYADSK